MRASGILMHISSLPGPYGIGTLGAHAKAFVDFLKHSGQQYWQILPLSPTGYGDSPYQSCSAFAGNPYFINLDALISQGLLLTQEVTSINWEGEKNRVDFGSLYLHRPALLRKAYTRFSSNAKFDNFIAENNFWLSDYSLYMALKDQNHGKPWHTWDAPVKMRQPQAIRQAKHNLKDEIRFHCFVQYLFYTQWNALRKYANDNGIRLIGDVPIYVPYDSADVWSHQELFQLDENGTPTAVAGCPPDAFSTDGQLWGNPLYRWDKLKDSGYRWWLMRLCAAGKMYDTVRLDHFRGFEAYWSVPYGDKTAKNGQWICGPGMDFFRTVQQELPQISLIAEDLGYLTPEVLALRDESRLPGMKVLGFAFDSEEPSDYLPHNCVKNSVCYTGTHDNMTTRQWLETADPAVRARAVEYMHLTPQEGLVWGVIRTAFSTVSELCIVPMQDFLNLDGNARMNLPGSQSDKNWTWRADSDFTSPDLAEKIRRMTKLYGRLAP